jgi:hypothetical protein
MANQGADNKTSYVDYPYKYMYNLQTIAESAAGGTPNPKEWFKS